MRCIEKTAYSGGGPVTNKTAEMVHAMRAMMEQMGGKEAGVGIDAAASVQAVQTAQRMKSVLWKVIFQLDADCADFFTADPSGEFVFDAIPEALAEGFQIGKYYGFEIRG